MKIALVGYGKMGKAIEALAVAKGHVIVAKINSAISISQVKQADVAIEFSQPGAVVNNLKVCFEAGVPVVCGTTGWLNEKKNIEEYCSQLGGTFFYASNFSLGVNIFFKLNEILAGMMNQYPGYEITIDETHHTEKKDAPSGTAITLAETILSKIERKTEWVSQKSAGPSQIAINSFRIDPAPGTHAIKYSSTIDDIEIKHTAHSREGFAMGALMVAEWIPGKKGILGMGDFLKL